MKINECPVCGSNDREEVATLLSRATFSICLDCGHGYMSDGPDADYSGFQQNYTDEQLLDENCSFNLMAEQRYRHILNKVNFVKMGKCSILDVGCGYGHFLSKFTLWDKTGIDASYPSITFAEKFVPAASFKFSAFADDFFIRALVKDEYELISSHHVIEHLHNPKDFIGLCLKYLRLNGLLYFTLPTVDDIENYQPTFTDLYFLSHGLHPQIFSYASLHTLLKQHNIHWVDYKKEPFWPGLGNSYSLIIGKRERDCCREKFFPQKEIVAMSKIMVKRFFEKLNELKFSFYDIERCKKVAIYGAGTHTQALLEELDNYWFCDVKDVFPLIIDDNPREEEMFDIPIMTLEEALNYEFSGILISAPASEEQIGKRLREDDRIKVLVFGSPPCNKKYKE